MSEVIRALLLLVLFIISGTVIVRFLEAHSARIARSLFLVVMAFVVSYMCFYIGSRLSTYVLNMILDSTIDESYLLIENALAVFSTPFTFVKAICLLSFIAASVLVLVSAWLIAKVTILVVETVAGFCKTLPRRKNTRKSCSCVLCEAGTAYQCVIENVEEWKVIPKLGHKYSYKYDTDYHWQACSNEGCTKTTEKVKHTFVNGECVCGAKIPTSIAITDVSEGFEIKDEVNVNTGETRKVIHAKKGQTFTLTATASPTGTYDCGFEWESGATNKATITGDGLSRMVKCIDSGEVYISVYVIGHNSISTSITVIIEDVVKPQSVTISSVEGFAISNHRISVKNGDKFTLTATISPDDSEIKTVSWTSTGSESFIKLTPNGNTCEVEIIGAEKDNVKQISIYAETKTGSGSYPYDCVFLDIAKDESIVLCESVEITATDKDGNAITITNNTINAKVGDKITLTAEVTPDNAKDKSVTWSWTGNTIGYISNKSNENSNPYSFTCSGVCNGLVVDVVTEDGSNKKATLTVNIADAEQQQEEEQGGGTETGGTVDYATMSVDINNISTEDELIAAILNSNYKYNYNPIFKLKNNITINKGYTFVAPSDNWGKGYNLKIDLNGCILTFANEDAAFDFSDICETDEGLIYDNNLKGGKVIIEKGALGPVGNFEYEWSVQVDDKNK